MKILCKTDRLVLRNWSEGDIDDYAAMVADPEVMKFIGDGKPRDHVRATDFVHRMIRCQESRGWMRFVVELRETGEFVGFCGFDLDEGVLDFGWRYASKFWGAGYGGEAASAALELGQNVFKLKGIESRSFPENVGSVKIFLKLGMSFLRETEENGKQVVHYGYPEGGRKNA